MMTLIVFLAEVAMSVGCVLAAVDAVTQLSLVVCVISAVCWGVTAGLNLNDYLTYKRKH